MFGNKRNNLPPRPHPPDPEHILEDLSNADIDDVAFKIMKKDENAQTSTNITNTEDNYEKVKTYLNVKHQLKVLEETLNIEVKQLQDDNEEIRRLANDIRKEAKAALTTH